VSASIVGWAGAARSIGTATTLGNGALEMGARVPDDMPSGVYEVVVTSSTGESVEVELVIEPDLPVLPLVALAGGLAAASLALGLAYPRFPSFGVPCPTAILTVGLLLLAPRREVRLLGAIPVLWAAFGGSAAVLLNIRADFALVVAGLVLLLFAAAGPRRSAIRAA